MEHDEETMKSSDHLIDIGWGAGEQGGEIVAEGNWKKVYWKFKISHWTVLVWKTKGSLSKCKKKK